jgi:hypothetical protein
MKARKVMAGVELPTQLREPLNVNIERDPAHTEPTGALQSPADLHGHSGRLAV